MRESINNLRISTTIANDDTLRAPSKGVTIRLGNSTSTSINMIPDISLDIQIGY